MNKKDWAVELFSNGFNCSQTVLSVFSEEVGLDENTGRKISCGFGSGMRQGEACGAVTGAIMILGLKYGQYRADDKKSKELTYEKVMEFNRKFKDINGSIICRDLLGCDLGTEEGMREATENGLFIKICPKMIKEAIDILEKMI